MCVLHCHCIDGYISPTDNFQREVDHFGNLRTMIHAQKMPADVILKNTNYICKGVAAGVSYLHLQGLVHGDLKGNNV